MDPDKGESLCLVMGAAKENESQSGTGGRWERGGAMVNTLVAMRCIGRQGRRMRQDRTGQGYFTKHTDGRRSRGENGAVRDSGAVEPAARWLVAFPAMRRRWPSSCRRATDKGGTCIERPPGGTVGTLRSFGGLALPRLPLFASRHTEGYPRDLEDPILPCEKKETPEGSSNETNN